MTYKKLSYCLLLASVYFVSMSCKPSVPKEYLQPDEMEDILYDYHLADAMYRSNNGEAKTMIAYKAAVLKKNGVTEAEFDSSMVYYTRHTRLLQKIYESLSNRISKDALALGASANEINRYSLNSANGDTTNIWIGDRSMVLSPHKPFNVSSYKIPADSTFRPGDKLLLNFDTQFIYQDGSRDAVAVLAVKFNNDSVSTQTLYVSTPNHYSFQMTDSKHAGIKEIKGYFILNNNPEDVYSTTFKLMIVSNISLIRMHEKKQQEKENTDSLHTAPNKKTKDSISVLPGATSPTGKNKPTEEIPVTATIR